MWSSESETKNYSIITKKKQKEKITFEILFDYGHIVGFIYCNNSM